MKIILYILILSFCASPLYADETIKNKPAAPQESYTTKGLLNPFIDNLLADESTKRHMAIKDMRLDELYPKIEEYFKNGYLEYAKVALERLITLEDNQTKLKEGRLRLAKVYYDLTEYEAAQKAYSDFIELYPGSAKTEFAQYKAVDCGCKQIAECDRDQKNTHAAAKIAKDYLNNESCQLFRKETELLCKMCYERLIKHELSVAEFHAHRGKYTAAQKRIDYAKHHYLPEFPDARHKIEKLEAAIQPTSAKPKKNKRKSEEKKVSYIDKF
ncbi:MAG: outer membrane protein assembly factor BamD [Candidatus Babeliales bacterium]